jgi:hypothetical protein
MPGVYRPYTLADILGVLSGQTDNLTDTSTTGLGYFAEVDETLVVGDSYTTTVAAPTGWDQGTWGCVQWQ